MENRSEVIKDYLDLIVFVNRSNKLPDEKTNIRFKIIQMSDQHLELRCVALPSNRELCLATRHKRQRWIPAGHTKFIYIEKYCVDILNNLQRTGLLQPGYITSLEKDLSDLLISQKTF